ncbi:MAG: peptidoglycan DD-metalloendopeptidase family protein, partial [bacterium]
FSFILIGLFLLIPIVFSYSETVEELNNKISQKNNDISSLEKEIKQYQNELDSIGKQKSSLSNSIKELDLTKKKLVANIAVTQKKIDKTTLKIQGLSSQIVNKEDSISNNVDAISLYVKETNEFEHSNIMETLLSDSDFTTAWNDIDNMVTIREKIRDKIVELKQVKSELEDTRKQTIDAKKELVSLKTNLADQKKIVEQNTTEKKRLLTQTKNSEANYQKLLKDRLAKKDAFEKEVRDYESKIKFILDPSKLPSGGVLSWPLDYIYVTQFFGKTEAGKRLYANGTHNGVDFRASVGTPLKAMADGKVLGTGDTDLTCDGASFGKFVFIQYDNGLSSTYGHLSLIKVSEGQRVVRGEVIGYTGNTGYSTGPHLHLSLYASGAVRMQSRPSQACGGHTYTMPIAPVNAYLDPMYYLPPYKN